uniref:Uncharacterized protein n=1 Tax=uncultured marine virus TaxID=186617 RepID=A0A0F7L760_9VIRU|nr:hypothetical protein [uncultured marine virus]
MVFDHELWHLFCRSYTHLAYQLTEKVNLLQLQQLHYNYDFLVLHSWQLFALM